MHCFWDMPAAIAWALQDCQCKGSLRAHTELESALRQTRIMLMTPPLRESV